jgi:uncharacterized membrane protein YccC
MIAIDSTYLDPPKAALRLSDEERGAAITELERHAAEGRLSAHELAERRDTAHVAVTRGDLAPLFADLPVPDSSMRADRAVWGTPQAMQEPRPNLAAIVVALSPFVAVLLFFLTGTTIAWTYAWLWFLLIPVVAIIAFVGRPSRR